MLRLAIADSSKLKHHWINICKLYLEERNSSVITNAEERVENCTAVAMLMTQKEVETRLLTLT